MLGNLIYTQVKHLYKYKNFLTESVNLSDEIDNIVDCFVDLIDDGEEISFYSASGNMNYDDYINKNRNFEKFKPVVEVNNRVISRFNVICRPKDNSYEGFIKIMDNLNSAIGRLKEYGWILNDFKTKSDKGTNYGDPVKMLHAELVFAKLDVRFDSDDITIPDEDELRDKIEELGIPVRSIDMGDYEADVEFESNSYDGSLNSEAWYEEKFQDICDLLGFAGYSLDYPRSRVNFEY